MIARKEESQYIYQDEKRNEKARLLRTHDDWYVCECKPLNDNKAQWMPYIFGCAEFLCLTELDKKWAIDKRK